MNLYMAAVVVMFKAMAVMVVMVVMAVVAVVAVVAVMAVVLPLGGRTKLDGS